MRSLMRELGIRSKLKKRMKYSSCLVEITPELGIFWSVTFMPGRQA